MLENLLKIACPRVKARRRENCLPAEASAQAGALAKVGKLEITLFLFFAILSTSLLMPLVAEAAWYDASWPYRKKISINPDKVGSGGVTNFPILFSQTDNDLRFTASGGHVASSTAGEIVFTDVSGTKLDHEIESYTSTTGALVAWIKVPSISATSPTTLYVYYGNSSATYQPTNSAVWSNGYAGVYHLGDGDSTAASFYKDSTSNARHSTLTDSDGDSAQATGQVGNGMYFTVDDDYITFPTGYFGSPSAMTISAWVNSTTTPNNTLDRYEIFNIGDHVNMWIDCTDTCGSAGLHGYWWYEPATATTVGGGAALAGTGWRYIVFSGANGSQVAYVDAVVRGSNTVADTPDWANAGEPSRLGQHQGGDLSSYNGLIDEARISTTNRSAAWTLTEFNNQSSPSTFYSYGSEDRGQQARLNMPPNFLRTGGGLAGHWTFNGPNMTPNVRDVSGQGNHGNLVGQAATTTAIGKLGQALTFDGTNDYVTMGDVLDPGTGDLSAFAWIKTTGTVGVVVNKRDGAVATNAGYALHMTTNTLGFRFGDGSAARIGVNSTAPVINDGQWHHVGVTFTRTGNGQLYVDGVPAPGGSGAISAQQGNVNNAIALSVGSETNVADTFFTGPIDDVRVYNRALSAAEVANLYRVGGAKVNLSQNSKVTSGLVGLWSFNGPDVSWTSATAGTATDRSGGGNTGTLTNMSQSTSPVLGKLGQALNFDGSEDYVTYGDVLDVGTSNFTIAAWVKSDVVNSAYHAIMTKNAGTCPNYQFGLHPNNKFFMAYETPSCAADSAAFTSSTISAGVWYHVVGVVDRTNGTTLYLDGVAQTTDTAETGNLNNDTGPLYIGRHDSGLYWDGIIDDVRFYNRALTAAEILQLYNLGKARMR